MQVVNSLNARASKLFCLFFHKHTSPLWALNGYTYNVINNYLAENAHKDY